MSSSNQINDLWYWKGEVLGENDRGLSGFLKYQYTIYTVHEWYDSFCFNKRGELKKNAKKKNIRITSIFMMFDDDEFIDTIVDQHNLFVSLGQQEEFKKVLFDIVNWKFRYLIKKG